MPINTAALTAPIAQCVAPFFEEIVERWGDKIHSLYVVGSALTPDYNPKRSDINTLLVMKDIDLPAIEALAPLGRKYAKKSLAAPLILTPRHIETSLDVFPIEFMDFSLVHHCAYGDDLLAALVPELGHLRLQCEREFKVRLIALRQGYLRTMGDERKLHDEFTAALSGYVPLFRASIRLMGQQPPVPYAEVIDALEHASGVDCTAYRQALALRNNAASLGKTQLDELFENFYMTTSALSEKTDAIAC